MFNLLQNPDYKNLTIWDAIRKYAPSSDKNDVGNYRKTIKKITGVRKNKKGTIVSYYVDDLGWITKDLAIQLTQKGQIDAVIAHSSSGSVYLKSRPDNTIENNLDNIG